MNLFGGSFFSQLGDRLNEQVWFQQLKQKWEELDPQSRNYLKYSMLGGGILAGLILVLVAGFQVRGLSKELAEKAELLTLIQNANDELRRLKESGAAPPAPETAAQPWPAYFETAAGNAGIERPSLSVQPEKPASGTSDLAKESIMEINLKKIGIRQLARFAFFVENGGRPVKLRNLTIDTHGEATGFMDATVTVSAFSIKQAQ